MAILFDFDRAGYKKLGAGSDLLIMFRQFNLLLEDLRIDAGIWNFIVTEACDLFD